MHEVRTGYGKLHYTADANPGFRSEVFADPLADGLQVGGGDLN